MTEIGGSGRRPRMTVHMGNDITAPHESSDEERPHVASRDAGAISGSATGGFAPAGAAEPHPDPPRRHPGDEPDATSYGDVARFRDLPPLKAAQGYGRRALEAADRAEWEAGVARQAAVRGDVVFARDVADSAMRYANSAQFFEALMDSAISGWLRAREGRSTSPAMRKLASRVHVAVTLSRATTDAADALVTDVAQRRAGNRSARPERATGTEARGPLRRRFGR